MKVKNINIIERHIEKLLLGIAIIVSLLIVYLYIIGTGGTPYGVSLGPDQNLPPGEVPGKIWDKARLLEAAVNKKESPLPPIPVPSYANAFQSAMTKSPSHGVREYAVPIGGHGLNTRDFDIKPPPKIVPRIVLPPAPFDLVARADFGLLADPTDPEVRKGLINLIGNHQPADFRWVSVSATVDFDEWRKMLRTVPEGERIPEDIFKNRMGLTYVLLERQQVDAAGGAVTQVTPLPGYIGMLNAPAGIQQAEAMGLVQQVQQQQAEIARQPFPALAGERPWFPPDSRVELSPESLKKWNELSEEIVKIQKKIEQTKPAAATPAPTGKPATAPPASPKTTTPAPKPGVATGQPPAAPASGVPSSELSTLQTQLSQKLAERAQLLTNKPQTGPDAARAGEAGGEGSNAPIGRIQIWAHDLTVKPGETYQYRFRVACVNPLFQAPMAKEPAKPGEIAQFDIFSWVSQPSAWSKPVRVDPETQTFLVSVNANVNDPTNQKATFEVWRIFDGRWQPKSFEVTPGDTIGGIATLKAGNHEASLDFRTPYVLVNVAGTANAGRASVVDTSAQDILVERSAEKDREDRQKLGGAKVAAAEAPSR